MQSLNVYLSRRSEVDHLAGFGAEPAHEWPLLSESNWQLLAGSRHNSYEVPSNRVAGGFSPPALTAPRRRPHGVPPPGFEKVTVG